MPETKPVVLVVEDEILIRMDVVEQLGAKGYILIEACNAREALDAIGAAERVDLLFTDVDMPGDLDGIMLAREVARSWPKICIIVTSGKSPIAAERLPPHCRFYAKPYETDAIHAAMREMLSLGR